MITMQAAQNGHVGLALLERSDGEALRRLFYRLSPETIWRRFHSPIVHPEQAHPDRLLDIDHHDREAVVAVIDGEIVGVARYAGWPGTRAADLAVVVADDWQRQGVATRMVSGLADHARSAGVQCFTATMHADNQAALALLRRFHPSGATFSQGLCEATVPINEADGPL
jgi:RimJ/RimL family protein N-acetyltransferase